MVDTGCKTDFDNGKLEKKLNSMAKDNKTLSGIIITHNHSDHVSALSKILTKKYKQNGLITSSTRIYYNPIYLGDS